MSKVKLIIIAAAVAMVIAGCIMMGIAYTSAGGFRAMSTDNFVQDTMAVNGYFDSVNIRVTTTDVRIEPSRDGRCSIESNLHPNTKLQTDIIGGELVICEVDERRWYEHISVFSFEESGAVLYLPQTEYDSLRLLGTTSDVVINGGLTFARADIEVSTGDVECRANIQKSLSVQASTGDLTLSGLSGTDTLRAKTTTGDIEITQSLDCGTVEASVSTGGIELDRVTAQTVVLSGRTSDIEIRNVVAADLLEITATTGDIEFDRCDGGEVVLKTSTGDIEGSFISGKMFDAHASGDRVRVPVSDKNGGACKVQTSSGSIDITVK